jgi:hypothetical protein
VPNAIALYPVSVASTGLFVNNVLVNERAVILKMPVEVTPNMKEEGKVQYTGGSKSDVHTILVPFYLCNHYHYHLFCC